ncbi:MAG TPA: hypothetical protein VF072_15355 [Thermoleophilaceae bacterium]
MVLGATGALPAAAHHPSVTEYQTGLSTNAGPWDLVDGGDGLIGEVTGRLSYRNPRGITRDLARRRNVLLRAGHRYLARAPGRAARLRR